MRLKRQLSLILLLVGFAITTINAQQVYRTTSSVAQVSGGKTTTYTVKMGDTAYSIAAANKTTVEEVFRLNPGIDQGIKIGQVLYLPVVIDVNQGQGNKHQIEAKETLFSVSKKYGITVAELLQANPGLSESSFSIGREINIPSFASNLPVAVAKKPVSTDVRHKVEKQETLYSISKKYECLIDEILKANPTLREVGLKEGAVILVPNKNPQYFRYDAAHEPIQSSLYSMYYLPEDGVVRIALLMPFIAGTKNVPKEKMTEYYEGFLLAVQRMKEKGLNAEVYTFDIGTDSDTRRLESILETSELNSLNLIIGGVTDKQVQTISKFSQRTGIKYVVPFSNKNTGVESNPNMYQVANSHSNLFLKIARGFVNRFKDHNIIFLSESGSNKNKMDFVKELQKQLKDANVPFKVTASTASITDDLSAVMNKDGKNIIIPTSSSESSLQKALEAITVLSKSQINISLFGYPEWQAYVNKTQGMYQVNTYIYSMFYLDTTQPDAQMFADKYARWYNKKFTVSIPRYAHMGYDTGLTFMSALQELGHDFSSRIAELRTSTLQSALYFESENSKGGYINTGVYFVNFRPNKTVEKIEISRQ